MQSRQNKTIMRGCGAFWFENLGEGRDVTVGRCKYRSEWEQENSVCSTDTLL